MSEPKTAKKALLAGGDTWLEWRKDYYADLSGADLRGADLSGADLRGAVLSGADLSGADLSGASGVLVVGPCDEWLMYAVSSDDGPRIKAGCRWFTVEEARAHWNGEHTIGPEHAAKMIAGVDALLSLARAHGWKL